MTPRALLRFAGPMRNSRRAQRRTYRRILMVNDVVVFLAGAASGIIVTALALHLSRKTVLKTVADYLQRHVPGSNTGPGTGTGK
jgi:hypothetical protein